MSADRQKKATAEFLMVMKQQRDLPEELGGKLLRAVASKTGEGLVAGNEFSPGTPVDTGFARASWFVTEGENPGAHPNPPLQDEHGNLVPGTGSDPNGPGVLVGAQLGDIINWINDADYIVELDNGHSQQAPAGMTAGIVASFDTLVEREQARLGIGG